MGKDFRKGFRILELGKRKGRQVVEKDFHEIFRSTLHGFSPFSLVILDRIELILVWFERSLHSAQVNRQSCP